MSTGFGGAVKLTGESAYRKALREISQDLRELSAETKLVSAQYANNSKSLEALTAKQAALNKQYEAQAQKVKILKDQYSVMTSEQEKNRKKHDELVAAYKAESDKLEQIGKEVGETSAEYKLQAGYVSGLASEVNKSSKAIEQNETQMSRMRTELTNATTEMTKTENELNALDKELEDTTKGSEALGKGIKGAGDDANKAAKGGFTVFKGMLANLSAQAITAAIKGIKNLGGSLVSIGKEAYNAYSEFEQLTGGVETLFKDAANIVKKNAAQAYKTAGMSANDYMQTVTSFSASLLKSLGNDTKKAAEYADKALRDMSDNANKLGTDIGSIQNAYTGFAKSNFTMLDNLKLGFSGTRQGAQDLIAEAERLDKTFKAQRDSSGKVTLAYSDMVDAIHIVQTEMGITGTTAKEAEETIEGSSKAMAAAWKNLLVSIADDNGDIKKATKNLTDTVEAYLKNAVPRVKKIIEGLFTGGKKLAKKYMPEVYNTVAPTLEKLGKILKNIVTFITQNFSKIVPIVAAVVAAFTAFNAVMAVSKTVNAVSTAMSALSATVSTATKVQVAYNAALASNPIGAVLTALAALAVAFSLASEKESEVMKTHRETMEAFEDTRDEIDANIEAWNDLKDAQQKQIDAGMTEQKYYEDLYNELKKITDANGKIKDGYEERADFIITQLNEAYDLEITKTGNIIDNYEGITGAIDYLIKKKKAQIILDSQQALYAEALENQASALREYGKLYDQLTEAQSKSDELQEQFNELQKEAFAEAKKNGQTHISTYYQNQLNAIQESIDAKNAEVDAYQEAYSKQEALVSQYAYNIGVYEKNMELAHAGEYDKMVTATWDYVEEFKSAEDAEKEILQDKIRSTEDKLTLLRSLRDKYNTDIYDDQIESAKQLLDEYNAEMKQYEQATEEAQNTVTDLWKTGLDNQVFEVDSHKVELRSAGNGLVDVYIDEWRVGKDLSQAEAQELIDRQLSIINGSEPDFEQAATDVKDSFVDTYSDIKDESADASQQAVDDALAAFGDNVSGFEKAGNDAVKGFAKGSKNESLQKSVFNNWADFGKACLKKFKDALQEHSPSKATEVDAKNLLLGFDNGLIKNRKNTLAQVSDFAKDIVTTFDEGLGDGLSPEVDMSGITTGGGVGSTTGAGAISGGNVYENMVGAFKEALAQMTVELDDRQVGKFVTKTVTNAIYNV